MNLESLKGVGDETLKLLTKLNISTVQELLEYYPYRYEFIHVVRLQDCVESPARPEGESQQHFLGKCKLRYQ